MGSGATRVLVTGGAGFLGAQLVRALCGSGHSVRVLDDFSTGKRERLAGLDVEILAADVRNAAAVRRAVVGAEVVFHLAWVRRDAPASTMGDLLHAEEVNVGGALNLLQAARLARTGRVVFGGSGAVYGRAQAYVLHEDVAPIPATVDAAQHLAVESYARVFRELHGVPSVTLRLFRIYGPGEPWDGESPHLVPALCRAALEGQSPRLFGDGGLTRDLLYLDNAVHGLCIAGTRFGVESGTYNVASGEAVSLDATWKMVAGFAGYSDDAPEPVRLPPPPHALGAARVSIARACRLLGYTPPVLLREGLRRTFEDYRQRFRSKENGWFSPAEERSAARAAVVATQGPRFIARRLAPPPSPPSSVSAVSPSLLSSAPSPTSPGHGQSRSTTATQLAADPTRLRPLVPSSRNSPAAPAATQNAVPKGHAHLHAGYAKAAPPTSEDPLLVDELELGVPQDVPDTAMDNATDLELYSDELLELSPADLEIVSDDDPGPPAQGAPLRRASLS